MFPLRHARSQAFRALSYSDRDEHERWDQNEVAPGGSSGKPEATHRHDTPGCAITAHKMLFQCAVRLLWWIVSENSVFDERGFRIGGK